MDASKDTLLLFQVRYQFVFLRICSYENNSMDMSYLLVSSIFFKLPSIYLFFTAGLRTDCVVEFVHRQIQLIGQQYYLTYVWSNQATYLMIYCLLIWVLAQTVAIVLAVDYPNEMVNRRRSLCNLILSRKLLSKYLSVVDSVWTFWHK